jgi:Flp pilus assembly secretin CpaC
VLTATVVALPATAQQLPQEIAETRPQFPVQPVVQKIEAANSKVEMMVNGSRILMLEGPIPKAQVANPDLLDFTVLSENQVQIHAKKRATTVNLWDEKVESTRDVIILASPRAGPCCGPVSHLINCIPTSSSPCSVRLRGPGRLCEPHRTIAYAYYPRSQHDRGGSQKCCCTQS